MIVKHFINPQNSWYRKRDRENSLGLWLSLTVPSRAARFVVVGPVVVRRCAAASRSSLKGTTFIGADLWWCTRRRRDRHCVCGHLTPYSMEETPHITTERALGRGAPQSNSARVAYVIKWANCVRRHYYYYIIGGRTQIKCIASHCARCMDERWAESVI